MSKLPTVIKYLLIYAITVPVGIIFSINVIFFIASSLDPCGRWDCLMHGIIATVVGGLTGALVIPTIVCVLVNEYEQTRTKRKRKNGEI